MTSLYNHMIYHMMPHVPWVHNYLCAGLGWRRYISFRSAFRLTSDHMIPLIWHLFGVLSPRSVILMNKFDSSEFPILKKPDFRHSNVLKISSQQSCWDNLDECTTPSHLIVIANEHFTLSLFYIVKVLSHSVISSRKPLHRPQIVLPQSRLMPPSNYRTKTHHFSRSFLGIIHHNAWRNSKRKNFQVSRQGTGLVMTNPYPVDVF